MVPAWSPEMTSGVYCYLRRWRRPPFRQTLPLWYVRDVSPGHGSTESGWPFGTGRPGESKSPMERMNQSWSVRSTLDDFCAAGSIRIAKSHFLNQSEDGSEKACLNCTDLSAWLGRSA